MYSKTNINILIPLQADVDSLVRGGVNASMHVRSRNPTSEECVVYCVMSNKLYMVYKMDPCNKNVSSETVRQLTTLESVEERLVLAGALGLKRGPDYG